MAGFSPEKAWWLHLFSAVGRRARTQGASFISRKLEVDPIQYDQTGYGYCDLKGTE
jgi:hypothetical protein